MGPLLNFHPQVTRYLLEHGADPDVQRNENIIDQLWYEGSGVGPDLPPSQGSP